MSTDTSMAVRSHEENWLPILELAVEEVFEIMLGCRVKPVTKAEHYTKHEDFPLSRFGLESVARWEDECLPLS